MTQTKTTLCMLLAAALGSTATATHLWRLERTESSSHRYSYSRENPTGLTGTIHSPGRATPYSIPQKPIPTTILDTLILNAYEEGDTASGACNNHEHILETIDGVTIAYTTPHAQESYHQALSRVKTKYQDGTRTSPQDHIRFVVKETMKETYGQNPITLNDGTPVIDYPRAREYLSFVLTCTGE